MKNANQPILDNQFEDNKGLTKREYFAAMGTMILISAILIALTLSVIFNIF